MIKITPARRPPATKTGAGPAPQPALAKPVRRLRRNVAGHGHRRPVAARCSGRAGRDGRRAGRCAAGGRGRRGGWPGHAGHHHPRPARSVDPAGA
ncbi:hypothetical protein MAP_3629c [Mycobacterium avium subsp. paratuberculosis K-10]|uniref:Uncharacterized protein n=1 Tax=Mycolicibacterium paratuberculosis (strain ATCC BAA-968 / K-10) TaxID=262316 RepID=Q73TT9_MYCPA|nr:hypothetical protein MAP_3629c [Mycobacterium avium subsp. paratuberculosis K-10]